MLSCPVVSQVLLATLINKSVLMALWRIAISGSGCQVVFSLVLVVLSNPRSKAKINIVKLFLFVLRKIVSSSCYICQAPGAIINTSSGVWLPSWPGSWHSLTGALVFSPGQVDQPPLAGLGGPWGRLMESHTDNLDRDKLISAQDQDRIDEKIAPNACFL